jgi:hypothetical protein
MGFGKAWHLFEKLTKKPNSSYNCSIKNEFGTAIISIKFDATICTALSSKRTTLNEASDSAKRNYTRECVKTAHDDANTALPQVRAWVGLLRHETCSVMWESVLIALN